MNVFTEPIDELNVGLLLLFLVGFIITMCFTAFCIFCCYEKLHERKNVPIEINDHYPTNLINDVCVTYKI